MKASSNVRPQQKKTKAKTKTLRRRSHKTLALNITQTLMQHSSVPYDVSRHLRQPCRNVGKTASQVTRYVSLLFDLAIIHTIIVRILRMAADVARLRAQRRISLLLLTGAWCSAQHRLNAYRRLSVMDRRCECSLDQPRHHSLVTTGN